MSWFHETREIPSGKNGVIRCTRYFGRWRVTVDSYDETSPYITLMWKKCLRLVPRRTPVKRVLLLGLGAGGNIEVIRRRFPRARITAVEWDPEMITLSHALKLYRDGNEPEIIQGDAAEVVPKLTSGFDLIIFDLYHGKEPSPLIREEAFLRELKRLLSWDGYFLVNVFQAKEVLVALDHFFSRRSTFHFKFNTCASYRQFGRGKMGDPLPAGYIPYRQDQGYVRREVAEGIFFDGFVGEPGNQGKHWHHGPLHFEGYFGDREPKPTLGQGRRMVIWQPITSLDRPKGWMLSPFMMNTRRTGFAEIGPADSYWKRWSSHAQRHRQHWLKHHPYDLVPISADAFIEAYERSEVRGSLKHTFLFLLHTKRKAHGDLVHYLVAKTRPDGRIVAGFAFLDVPESRQSIHLISFISREASKSSVGTGLMDAWFRYGLQTGLRFLDFDTFYSPHDPWAWRGFSTFKSQFGVHFIVYPHALVRFVK